MRRFSPIFLVLATFCMIQAALAETTAGSASGSATVNTTEGVSGFLDKKRRAPSLSVGVNRGTSNGVKLLADAYVANEEYTEYPIKFEFFVNRSLVATQIRSKELPGPVGIDVDVKKNPFPFNYSVIATVLGPNRTFTTVLNGAVFSSDLAGGGAISSCQLTLSDAVKAQGANAERVYAADSVSISQTSNSSVQVVFETSTLSDGSKADPVSVTATISVDGEKASGEVTVTEGDNSPTTATATGTASVKNGQVDGFSVGTTDNKTSLTCG